MSQKRASFWLRSKMRSWSTTIRCYWSLYRCWSSWPTSHSHPPSSSSTGSFSHCSASLSWSLWLKWAWSAESVRAQSCTRNFSLSCPPWPLPVCCSDPSPMSPWANPVSIIAYAISQCVDFFVPVMGRVGVAFNPEFVMAPLALVIAFTFVLFLVCSSLLAKVLCIILQKIRFNFSNNLRATWSTSPVRSTLATASWERYISSSCLYCAPADSAFPTSSPNLIRGSGESLHLSVVNDSL